MVRIINMNKNEKNESANSKRVFIKVDWKGIKFSIDLGQGVFVGLLVILPLIGFACYSFIDLKI